MQQSDPIEILLVEDDPDDAELALSAVGEHGSMNHVRVCNNYVVRPVDFDQFRAVTGRIVNDWLRLNTPAW